MQDSLSLDGRTVLILEDEFIIAFALEAMLTGMGAKVVMASSIQEAEARIADTALSLAILDVNVRGTQSYTVAAELSARGVPLIFATGYGEAEHPPQFASAATLTKPYSQRELAETVRAII